VNYKTALREVLREVETSREQAENAFALEREKFFKKNPRLAEIEKKLNELGLLLSRLALSGDLTALENLRREMATLKNEKNTIISRKRFKNSPNYNCKNCNDTGYIQEIVGLPSTACTCLKQRLIEKCYSLSNMRGVLQNENFANFDISLFSTDIFENEGLSPRVNMEQNYKIAVKFVQEFDSEFKNLIFYGESGLGKTYLSHCIAKDLLDAGKTVLYLTVPRFCKIIEDARFNRDSLAAPEEMLSAADDVDLLVLDDLGAEISTMVTSAAIFDIINQRLLTRKATVISTNLSHNGLVSQYTERIVSRFLGNYEMKKFFGEDIRIKKKYGG
jgi:DNA replication protein DnaC